MMHTYIPRERKRAKKITKRARKEAKWNPDNARALTALVNMQQLHTCTTLRDRACRMLMAALFLLLLGLVTQPVLQTTTSPDSKNHAYMYTRTYIHLRLISRTEFESSLGEARMHRASYP